MKKNDEAQQAFERELRELHGNNVKWVRGSEVGFHDDLRALVTNLEDALRCGEVDDVYYLHAVFLESVEHGAGVPPGTMKKFLDESFEK
jgi:hypothetical protein